MTLDIRPLTEVLAVAPQVTADDIRALAAAGYKTVINNRPDGEEPGQFSSAEASDLCASLGLSYIYMPTTTPTLDASCDAFARALSSAPRPVLAHCRSGTRSTILWALAEAKTGHRNCETILRMAATAGYDLSSYAAKIDQYTQARAD